jgi:small subunit ribosomal protein S16
LVKIRLKRFGAKKNPHYRIVVTDSRRARDGAYLESLGHYDPRGNQEFTLDEERLGYWVKEGAQVSLRVNSLLKRKHEAQGTASAQGTAAAAVKEKPVVAPADDAADDAADDTVAETSEASQESAPHKKPESEVKAEDKAEPQKEEDQQSADEQVES